MWPLAILQDNTRLGLCTSVSHRKRRAGKKEERARACVCLWVRGGLQRLPFSLQVAPLSHGAANTREDYPDLRTSERTMGCGLRAVCVGGGEERRKGGGLAQ